MNGSIALTDIEKFNIANEADFKELPEYKLKIRTFANKTVDYIVTKTNFRGLTKEPFKGNTTFYPKMKTDLEKTELAESNVERASRRARQAVHFHVRGIGADHMLTLSIRENITDVERFDAIFKKFLRLVREKYLTKNGLVNRTDKYSWPYVAVRELQERGALHMHIACCGKQDLATLRACWYVALGGNYDDHGQNTLGQIDVQARTRRFSGETEIFKTFKLVGYLTKYISKTFENDRELGSARYKASRSNPKPIINKQYLQAYFSYGDKPFIDAMTETISIANFHGCIDYELWNKGFDIFILRGSIN